MIKGSRGGGGAAQSVRGNYKFFTGINMTVSGRMHQFKMRGGRDGRGSSICACVIVTFALDGYIEGCNVAQFDFRSITASVLGYILYRSI